jgi:hypothetical protein
MPALDYGERRVQIEGSICPELRNGLQTAFRVIRDWYPQCKIPVIEATAGFHPSVPEPHRAWPLSCPRAWMRLQRSAAIGGTYRSIIQRPSVIAFSFSDLIGTISILKGQFPTVCAISNVGSAGCRRSLARHRSI